MQRFARRAAAAAAALLALAALGGGGLFLWLRTSLPPERLTVEAAGLSQPVEIFRDAHGVPHIFAASFPDAYFALGFAHAQDRLFQMEYLRRLATGRLSEIVGDAALGVDRFMRLLGLEPLADGDLAAATPALREALQRYAAGVNAWRDQREGALPPALFLLDPFDGGHEPAPWQPRDSLLWGRLMAFQLSTNWRTELLRARLLQRLPAARVAELWPGEPADAPTTFAALSGTGSVMGSGGNGALDALWAAVPWNLLSASASNAWAIAGSRSESGKPLLANDPHLGLGSPGIWYLARIVTPEGEIAGATVPGVPLHVLGHNNHLAWGLTTVGGDVADLFVERLVPGSPYLYQTPEGPAAFATRIETIAVDGSAPETMLVRQSRHGPVLSDLLPAAAEATGKGEVKNGETGGTVLALAATGLLPEDRTANALLRMNRARTADDFLDAVREFDSPLQNILFATVDGSIGLAARARVPIRRAGNGSVPAPGHDGSHDWVGLVPADDLPTILDPASGSIVNANNRLVGADFPYLVALDWDYGFRAERIEATLGEPTPHGVAAAQALQHDTFSPAAHQLLPLMLATLGPVDDPRGKSALDILRRWDHRMSRDEAAPLIFTAWLRETVRTLAADELGPLFEDYWDLRPRFVAAALTDAQHWCDDVATPVVETCSARLALALDSALDPLAEQFGDDVAAWRWGGPHRAAFRHPVLGHVPVLRRIADQSIATDGGNFSVNRGHMAAGGGAAPFRHIHGAGYKAVYDLARPARSQFMVAPGQSGNPLSPHYGDLMQPWRDGEYLELSGDRATVAAEARSTVTLRPARP